MGNPIKFTELFDKSGVDAGFKQLIGLYKGLEKDAKKSILSIKTATKDIIPTTNGAAEAISKQSKEFKTQKKVVDESQKAIKALTTAQNKLKTAQSNVGIETAKVRDAIARQNRLTKQEITLNRSKEGSMVRLGVELGKNRQRYRELSAAQRANVNIGGKLITTIKQQDANIKKLDASIGNNQRSVGNYGIALQGATRLLGALGLAGGIALVVRGVREMIGIFSGFEKQMAKVRAISGATEKEFTLLVNDAKRLGESTEKTASQVGELQLAFAKLGFTTPQIIAATEATLNLATATDEDLAQSALVAAKTIKGFNLSAEETTRVTDVMALSFSSSALNLNAFQDAMKTVAPVAVAVNSTLESTTAVLSALVDAGLDASTAGTSLRNIFIELETQGLTWDEAMQQVRDSTNKVKTATELFGKRASTAALIIANNSEKIDTLTISYENAAGSAQVMADIMRDTLTGDVDRATSAIQGMVIEIGEKLTPILRAIVRGFTFFISNIGAFIKIIGIAGAGLAAYTLITKGATIFQRAYTIAVNIARIATKAFNTTVKASPLGLLLGLLAAATAAFFAFRDSTDEATESEENFGDQLERGNKLLDERAKKLFDLENVFIKQGESLTDLTNNFEKVVEIINEQIGFDKIRLELLRELIVQRKLLLKQQLLESEGELVKIGDEILTLQGKREATKRDVALSRLSLKIFEDEIDANNRLLLLVNKRLAQLEDDKKSTGSLIEIQKELLEIAKLLPETTEKELVIKNRKIKAINDEIKRLKALGIEKGKGSDKDIDIEKIRQRLALLRAKNIEDELKRVKITEEVKFKIKKDNLEKERVALIKSGGDKLVINKIFEQLQTELLIEHERIRAEKRIEVVLRNNKELNDEILKELELSLINQGVKEEEIGEQLLAKKIELLEKEIILRKDIGAETLDQELELAKFRLKVEKDLQDDLRELRDFGIGEAIKAIQRKADAALKAANEEIAATDKQISRQEALAAQGLENSLKFEQEARAEALLAKIEAEKQKERAEKISAFWNLLSNSDSVQEAITKFGIGEAFARTIEALPAFEEGGPTPGTESLIRVSEKGSEYVVKHGPAQDYLPQLQAMNKGTYNDTFGGYIDNAKFVPNKLPVNDTNVQLLIVEMKGMRKEIKNLIPNMETVFDSTRQESINIYKYADRKRTVHLKVPRL